MLSRLFIAALWSPEGKGLTSLLLCVMFIVILRLSLLLSRDRCGTWLYRSRSLLSFLLYVCLFVMLFLLRGAMDWSVTAECGISWP